MGRRSDSRCIMLLLTVAHRLWLKKHLRMRFPVSLLQVQVQVQVQSKAAEVLKASFFSLVYLDFCSTH